VSARRGKTIHLKGGGLTDALAILAGRKPEALKVTGIGRDLHNGLTVFFNREPTNDEMNRVHDLVRDGLKAPAEHYDAARKRMFDTGER
jgi:hypothetical protein